MKGLLALALMVALLSIGNTAAAGGPCPNLAGKYKCHHHKKNKTYYMTYGQTTDAAGVITYFAIKGGKKRGIRIADGQGRPYTTKRGHKRTRTVICTDANTLRTRNADEYSQMDIILSLDGADGLNLDIRKSWTEGRGEIDFYRLLSCKRVNQTGGSQ